MHVLHGRLSPCSYSACGSSITGLSYVSSTLHAVNPYDWAVYNYRLYCIYPQYLVCLT